MEKSYALKTVYQEKLTDLNRSELEQAYADYIRINEIVKKINTNEIKILQNDLGQRYLDLSYIQYFDIMGATLLSEIDLGDVDFVYLNILHQNEIHKEMVELIKILMGHSIIINNKMEWVVNINSNFLTIKDANLSLVELGVRPYCLLIPLDKQQEGIEILDRLRGWNTGLAVPHLITIDEMGDKKHVLPRYLVEKVDENYVFRNYKKVNFNYRNK